MFLTAATGPSADRPKAGRSVRMTGGSVLVLPRRAPIHFIPAARSYSPLPIPRRLSPANRAVLAGAKEAAPDDAFGRERALWHAKRLEACGLLPNGWKAQDEVDGVFKAQLKQR